MSRTKPALSRIRELAGSEAHVAELFVLDARGETMRHTWHHRRVQPELTWVADQRTLLWVYPKPKEKVVGDAPRSGQGARGYRNWTGREPADAVEVQLPSASLKKMGQAVRIVYRFTRQGSRWWHHDFTTSPLAYVGSNRSGPRVFAVTGPGLRFTSRGIMG